MDKKQIIPDWQYEELADRLEQQPEVSEIEQIITDHIYGDGVDAKSAAKKITGKWGMGVHGREVWHRQPISEEMLEGELWDLFDKHCERPNSNEAGLLDWNRFKAALKELNNE